MREGGGELSSVSDIVLVGLRQLFLVAGTDRPTDFSAQRMTITQYRLTTQATFRLKTRPGGLSKLC